MVSQVYAVCIAGAVVSASNHHFGVVLAVVPGLKSPFVLAIAVVDDFCTAVTVLLAVVPTCSYNLSFAEVITVVPG